MPWRPADFPQTCIRLTPQGLELSSLDGAALGQVFNKRVEHRMIIQPACCLALDEVDNKLQALLRAVQLALERADPFEEMLFQRWPEETFDPPIRRRGSSVRNYQKARATRRTGLTIVGIRMRALLTKNHRLLHHPDESPFLLP